MQPAPIIVAVLMQSGTFVMNKGFDADKFFHIVKTHRITGTFLVPTMIYVLLDHPHLAAADLASLRLVIYGASPMSPARLQEAIKVFGPVFMQLYAQSEAPNTVCVLRQIDHDPEHHPERLASCGLPMIGNQVKLLDENGAEVPVGEVGEISLRGPLVMIGYWNKPEETAFALRHGWLHTGDMARRDADGFIYIVDRSKDMIISGGFNVFPREVEDVLTRHPAVASAAVIGVPDEKWGEAVKALVVLKPGAEAAEAELIKLVRDAKGAVQAPKSIKFVEQLPVTGLGKLRQEGNPGELLARSDQGGALRSAGTAALARHRGLGQIILFQVGTLRNGLNLNIKVELWVLKRLGLTFKAERFFLLLPDAPRPTSSAHCQWRHPIVHNRRD